jgi:hypothetical protein
MKLEGTSCTAGRGQLVDSTQAKSELVFSSKSGRKSKQDLRPGGNDDWAWSMSMREEYAVSCSISVRVLGGDGAGAALEELATGLR